MKRLLIVILLLLSACGQNESNNNPSWQYIFQTGTVLEFTGEWQLHEQFVPGIIVFNNGVPMQIVEFPPENYEAQVQKFNDSASIDVLDLNENLTVYYQQTADTQQGTFLVVLPDRTSLGVTITAQENLSDYLPAVRDILATAHKPTYDTNIFAFDGRYTMYYPTDWQLDLNAGDAPFFITENTIIAVWAYSDEMLLHLHPNVNAQDITQVTQSVVNLGTTISPDDIELTEIAAHPVAIYRKPDSASQGIVFKLRAYHFAVTFGSRMSNTLNPEDEAAIYTMIESLITNARPPDE